MRSAAPVRDNFIATKLIPPRWDQRGVPRTPVLAQLAAPDARLSTMSIIAAAGSGKSTLMSQMHQSSNELGWATCWISLEPEDNNPATFAAYFIAALMSIRPVGDGSDFAIQKDFPIRAFEELFADLVAHVSAIRSATAIFVDDFHHITDVQVVAFMERLISHLPACVKLIIASRTRLPMELARARVSGALVEIEQEDLNFSPVEAREFLRRSHNLELLPEDFESLWSTTEGWAAGMQLAAIALRRDVQGAGALIRQFSGCDKDLMTYLAESVLNSQPESVRLFLLQTAPLRRMCAELCQVASAHPNPGEMLAHLERSRLFLIPLDRSGQWFRYHHLFGDFLRNQLRKVDPDAFVAICENAGQWCESQGMITEAIQYSLDAHQFDKAADLIADRALNFAEQGEHYIILDWMRRLPVEYHARRPQIWLSHAFSSAFSRDMPLAMELSDRVIARLRIEEGPDRWDLSASERQRLRFFGDLNHVVAKTGSDELDSGRARALELRKHCPEDQPFIISGACNCISYSHLARREYDDAIRVAADAYLYGQRARSTYAMVWADVLHGLADIELGRLRTAMEHAHRAKATADAASSMKSCSGAMAALLHAEISTQRCDFDQTHRHIEAGRSFALIFGMVEILQLLYRSDARACAWAGDLVGARRVLGQGREVALKSNYPRLFLSLALEEVVLQLSVGSVQEATDTAREFNLFDEMHPIRRFDAFSGIGTPLKLLKIRLVLAEGDPALALRSLSQLQYSLGSDGKTNLNLTLRSLKSLALWQLNRQAEAVRELDRALTEAANECCAYPIASSGRGLLPVLHAIAERRDAPVHPDGEAKERFQRRLIAILSGERPASLEGQTVAESSPGGRPETLTTREIELLRLVDAGLPNKKVADSLLISESTVKWHLHNINEKLGVANRTAAASKARDMLLL